MRVRGIGRIAAIGVVVAAWSCASEVPEEGGSDATPSVDSGRRRDIGADLAPADVDPADADASDAATEAGEPDASASDGSADAPADGDAEDDTPAEEPATDQAPLDCESARDALVDELYEDLGGCTVTVRLDYESYDILGFQVFCAAYTTVNEASARSRAQADSGYGSAGTMLNASTTDDYFVFHESAGDFGGAAAVSARTGRTTFGGSIVWDGAGDITYPTAWRPAGALASGCPPSGDIVEYRGWDLTNGSPLAQGLAQDAVAVVRETAIPGAFWWGGNVFDAVVLLYPRSVGAFDPSTAEWIVMVNGGWSE